MVIDSIAERARRTPDHKALLYNGQSWTYGALAHAITLARGYFAGRNCTGHGIAALAVHNLLDFWILSLALRSLGVTTVAVGSMEIARGLELPDLRCVVTSTSETVRDLDEFCAERRIPSYAVRLDGESGLPFAATTGPHGGHILLTSGTTGTFKMVLFDPAIERASHEARQKTYGLDETSVFNTFDFPPWTLVGYGSPVSSWIAGATLILFQDTPQYRALLPPGQTHAVLVPSMLPWFLNAPDNTFPLHTRMHLSLTGGTAGQAQIEAVKARITPHVYNRYGSTEVGTIALTRLDGPDDREWHRIVPGRTVEVVDESDHPVPQGEIGRLRVPIAGPTGYFRDPAATAAFFRDGYFYPGDLARLRADGRFALQGRATDVLNVQGHKISPAHAEDLIREALGVTGVCIVSVPGPSNEDDLIIVIEGAVDMARLQAVLRSESVMLPGAAVYSVGALPRNDMGKIVRRHVREQFTAARRTP